MDDKLLQAELNKAIATRKQAAQDVSRLTRLRKRKLIAEEEMLRATTALDVAKAEELSLATRLGYSRIHAPINGLISKRLVEPGDVVPKYTHLLTIIDTSKLLTEVAVSELLMPGLQIDDPVEIQIDALGKQTFMGRILRIHPALDAATRRGKIEVILDDPPVDAQPGQLCRVSLRGKLRQRNTIPYNALRRDNEGEFVYVIDADSRAQRRAVQTGLRFTDRVEVLHGLAENERVIVRGFLGLKPGKKVRTAAQQAANKPGASHNTDD
jgi:membrane fusion protein (multidrug efflux system)